MRVLNGVSIFNVHIIMHINYTGVYIIMYYATIIILYGCCLYILYVIADDIRTQVCMYAHAAIAAIN